MLSQPWRQCRASATGETPASAPRIVAPPAIAVEDIAGNTGFLDMAAELRNRIYAMVLVKGDEISLQLESHRREERSALAILGTCRQVNMEARGIYYSQNSFKFSEPHISDYRTRNQELATGIRRFFRLVNSPDLVNIRKLFVKKGVWDWEENRYKTRIIVRLDIQHLSATTHFLDESNPLGHYHHKGPRQKYEAGLIRALQQLPRGWTETEIRRMMAVQAINKAAWVEERY